MPSTCTLARDLIGQGLHVFPLRPRGKVTLANCDRCYPRTAPCRDTHTPCPCWPANPCHGFRAATTDPATVQQWWRRWPTANIGISPWPSGHVVIDLDTKSATPPATLLPAALGVDPVAARNGVDLFATVLRCLGDGDRLDTRITRTPSGGLHVWFTAPPGTLIASSRGMVHPDGHVTGLGWQIDVRAHGGYILAPGSTTRQGTYQVIRDRAPMPLPGWLARWIHLATATVFDHAPAPDRGPNRPPCRAAGEQAPGSVGAERSRTARIARAALAAECDQITRLRDGRKAALNKAAYKLGGYAAAGYLTAPEIRAALIDAGHAAGATRITTNVDSGLSAGMTKPRQLTLDPAKDGAT